MYLMLFPLLFSFFYVGEGFSLLEVIFFTRLVNWSLGLQSEQGGST
jgi:hypothetical protein